MSKRKGSYEKLPPFVPLFRETLASPAYRQLSFGSRALLTALRAHCVKNNGHVYLSLRDAGEEIGHQNRNDLANWFRELEHYGFIVQTQAGSLGIDGKGKAPHWRITDMPTRKDNNELASGTKDFLHWDGTVFEPHVRPSWRWNARKEAALKKQNPGRDVRTTVDVTFVPGVDVTFVPPNHRSGTDVTPIQDNRSGTDVTPITSIATIGLRMTFPCCQHKLRDWRAVAAE
jgi:hypothetical protein